MFIVGILLISIFSLGCINQTPCDNIKVTSSWEKRSDLDIKPSEILTDGTTTATLKITVNNNRDEQAPIKINVNVPNAQNVYCREVVMGNPNVDFVKLNTTLHSETIGPNRAKEWYVEYKSMNEIEGDYKINIVVTRIDSNCSVTGTDTIKIFEKKK